MALREESFLLLFPVFLRWTIWKFCGGGRWAVLSDYPRLGRTTARRASAGSPHSWPSRAWRRTACMAHTHHRVLSPSGRAQLRDGSLLQAVPVEYDNAGGSGRLRCGADLPQVSPSPRGGSGARLGGGLARAMERPGSGLRSPHTPASRRPCWHGDIAVSPPAPPGLGP